jgi:hypothetical protein
MPRHSHTFVETYSGLVGFGLDRPTDEATLTVYLQKCADDALAEVLLPRMDAEELEALFSTLARLLKKHLSEAEYHRLFLKETHEDR